MTSEFTIKRSRFHGSPTIEILKDGEPFWEDLPSAKKHFTFGVKKAILLLGCIDEIKNFVDSKGENPVTFKPIGVKSQKWKTECELRRYDGFKRFGAWAERPYLEIQSETTIRFGLLKAEAILLLQVEIQNFVMKHY